MLNLCVFGDNFGSSVDLINQITGIAKTCSTIDELRHKVALYYKKDEVQLAIGDNLSEPPESE